MKTIGHVEFKKKINEHVFTKKNNVTGFIGHLEKLTGTIEFTKKS